MGDLTFNCPYCGQKIEAPEEMAGLKADCPSCQCELQIPVLDQPGSSLPPPSSAPLSAPLGFSPAVGLGSVPQPNSSPHFVAAKCPSCGGDLRVPDDRDHVKCMYCGGAVIVRQAVQLVSGVNAANLMELATAAAAANNPEEAYGYYSRVLESDPKNPAAWAGKGEAAGWLSTVKDIKTAEMIASFNQAINCSPDCDKAALRRHCSDSIIRVASACYSISRQHLEKFAQVADTWPRYLRNSGLLISALIVAHSYDLKNKTSLETLIRICADNVRGMTVSLGRFGLLERKLRLDSEYEASLRATIDEYTAKLCHLDPNFVKPRL
jgi:DNA-directed RNA polymerase subunit RPC12/RpoP